MTKLLQTLNNEQAVLENIDRALNTKYPVYGSESKEDNGVRNEILKSIKYLKSTMKKTKVAGLATIMAHSSDTMKSVERPKINLYTSMEIESLGLHMTWDFNPGKCEFPEGVKEGQKDALTVVGKYEDKDCSCLIVCFQGANRTTIKTQPNGTLLHLTERVSNGVTPYECGQRATKNRNEIVWYRKPDYKSYWGVWKYTKSI